MSKGDQIRRRENLDSGLWIPTVLSQERTTRVRGRSALRSARTISILSTGLVASSARAQAFCSGLRIAMLEAFCAILREGWTRARAVSVRSG